MTTVRRASRDLGGIVQRPTLTRHEAEAVYGCAFPDSAWDAICAAFARYGWHLQRLEATRLSRSKDPAKAGWYAHQASTVKAIEAAMDRITAARRNRDFLLQASDNYCIQTFGHSALGRLNAERNLNEAYSKLFDALIVIERAEPEEIETPSEAESRRILVREIREALADADLDVSVSDGRGLPEDAAEADLTPFEQLVSAFGAHDAETPASFAKWMRRALMGQSGGNS